MKKKNSGWMKGFVIPPKTHPADAVRIETLAQAKDYRNKQQLRGR